MTRAPRIPKDLPQPKRVRENTRSVPKHLAWIRTLPCVIRDADCEGNIEAAHVRAGTDGGMGLKPSDKHSVPLCSWHHFTQHVTGELRFWADYGIDPVRLAERLWRVSGHTKQARRALKRARQVERVGG